VYIHCAVCFDTSVPIPVAAQSKAWVGVCGRLLACWDCGFESRPGHQYLPLGNVRCCQVEVSARE
jgi:hypothetical protein